MKTIKELELGFSDAQNYAQRQNKTMFNEVFVRNTFLDDLVKQSSFFLVGEKGTGKQHMPHTYVTIITKMLAPRYLFYQPLIMKNFIFLSNKRILI